MCHGQRRQRYVTQHDFEQRDLPIHKGTQMFLEAAHDAVNDRRKLALSVQVSKLAGLLETANFEGTEELEFMFEYPPLGSSTEATQDVRPYS